MPEQEQAGGRKRPRREKKRKVRGLELSPAERDLAMRYFTERLFTDWMATRKGLPSQGPDPFAHDRVPDEVAGKGDDTFLIHDPEREECALRVYGPSSHLTITDPDDPDAVDGCDPIEPIDTDRYTEYDVSPCDDIENDIFANNDCLMASFGAMAVGSRGVWNGIVEVFCKRVTCTELRSHHLYYNGDRAPDDCFYDAPRQFSEPFGDHALHLFPSRPGDDRRAVGATDPDDYAEKIYTRVSGCRVWIIAETQMTGHHGRLHRGTRVHRVDCCAMCEDVEPI